MANDEVLSWFLPYMAKAVMAAENNKRNHGVLSVKTKNPKQTLLNSVSNNYNRWVGGQAPAPWISMTEPHPAGDAWNPNKFVEFMGRRWAPIGVENDPEMLNRNWVPNVRDILQRIMTPEEYQKAKKLNLVMLMNQNRTV